MLEIEQEFAPALFALAIAVEHGDQFFPTVRSGSHQHQQALFLVGVIFQADLDVNAVRPEVDIVLL